MRYYYLKYKIVILCLIVLFVFSLNLFGKEVKNFFYFISDPFQSFLIEKEKGFSDFFEGLRNASELKLENEFLISENKKINSEINSLKNIRKENEELEKALELKLEEEFKMVNANFSGTINFKNNILLDKGREDGIIEGFPVITSEKVLVGMVDKVYEKFSSVRLILDKEISFNVEIVPKSFLEENLDDYIRYQGLVRNNENSDLTIELISKEAEIKEGDLVFTTGSEGFFPKELLVGTIKEIDKDDVEPFQKALIDPAFDLSKKRTVFVITNY